MMNFFTASTGNQLNRGKLLLFLGGKASIYFLPDVATLAPVVQAADRTRVSLAHVPSAILLHLHPRRSA
jgi:hypothetical protein